jgi:hypothetical protein
MLCRYGKLVALSVCLFAGPALAQVNPFQTVKDALNKAKQQLQQQVASTPAASTPARSTSTAVSSPESPAPATAAPPSPSASAKADAFVPPTDPPANPGGPLDPDKLMDIGGVHIGMPIAATVPILKRLHPEAPLQPQTAGRDEPMSLYRVSLVTPHPPPSDDVWVNYSFDTLTVYAVSRMVGYSPQISKTTLIEALRKKYGPETAALNVYAAPKSDANITKMWWLSDEQGKVLHPANMATTNYSPYGCGSPGGYGYDVTSTYRSAFRDLQSKKPPAETLCDSLISLYVELDNGSSGGHGDESLVSNSRTLLFDNALFRRSTIAWAAHLDARAQQQQQDALRKANQAKPNL